MKLVFKKSYASIESFNTVEIGNFSILTGLNGSGKTHLLRLIQGGGATIDDIDNEEIAYFNYQDFFRFNENTTTPEEINRERMKIWEHYTGTNKRTVLDKSPSLQQRMAAFKYEMKEKERQRIIQLANGKAILGLSYSDFGENETDLYEVWEKYKKAMHDLLDSNEFRGWDAHRGLINMIYDYSGFFDEVDENELKKIFNPIISRHNFLLEDIGKLFLHYRFREFEEVVIAKVEDEQFGTNSSKTIDEYRRIYGPKPWEVLYKIFEEFESFEFEVNNPENIEFRYPYTETQFVLQIRNKKTQKHIPFYALSSGEKIIFALIHTIYSVRASGQFPKVLLFDEIDASLHPSMIKHLLKVIEKIFVKEYGMIVILATHSPTTVALANEGQILYMQPNGENRIIRVTKEKALKELSEGFVTLTNDISDLGLTYNISRNDLPVLFTEGITDKIIIEKAWEKLYPEEDQPFYIQDAFDASFLGNLFKRGEDEKGILRRHPNRIFMALFDFDSAGYQQWNALKKVGKMDFFSVDYSISPYNGLVKKHHNKKAYALLLPVPVGKISQQVIDKDGRTYEDKALLTIELLFTGEKTMKKYFKEEGSPGGGTILKFKGEKRNFAEDTDFLPKESFLNFQPLFHMIQKIIQSD